MDKRENAPKLLFLRHRPGQAELESRELPGMAQKLVCGFRLFPSVDITLGTMTKLEILA